MELTKEQIESLAKFALDILNEFPEMGDFDGGDIQDIAITRNLLVPQIVHAPCAEEDCNCAQFYDDADFTAGVTCYHIADWLDRVAEQRNEAEADTTDAELCDCGEPFPKNGECRFCGARQRHLS